MAGADPYHQDQLGGLALTIEGLKQRDELVFRVAEARGIPVSIVRIFGSYGPRQNLSWWGGPQSVFISAVLQGESLPIHGDGSQTRSFTYVSDTVDGLERVLENGPSGEVFNIGNTREISILKLAHMIYELAGERRSPQIEFVSYENIAGRKYEDVLRRIPDITKASTMLGFTPRVHLEEGLRLTIDWQRQILSSKAELTTAS